MTGSMLALLLALSYPAVPIASPSAYTTVQEARPAAASAQPVNVNTATVAQFEALPGIGPSMAQRIVAYRDKNGPFKKLDDLMNIQGIGEKSFLKLRPLLTIGGQGDAKAGKN
jgi:competence protein ComEA